MSNEDKSTARPWYYHRAPRIGGEYVHIIQAAQSRGITVAAFSAGSGSDRIDSICAANAEFIVRAANAHDAMVAALEELIGGLRYLGMPEDAPSMARAVAAVKLARGQA